MYIFIYSIRWEVWVCGRVLLLLLLLLLIVFVFAFFGGGLLLLLFLSLLPSTCVGGGEGRGGLIHNQWLVCFISDPEKGRGSRGGGSGCGGWGGDVAVKQIWPPWTVMSNFQIVRRRQEGVTHQAKYNTKQKRKRRIKMKLRKNALKEDRNEERKKERKKKKQRGKGREQQGKKER